MKASSRRTIATLLIVAALPLLGWGCVQGPRADARATGSVVWRPVGTWTGQGSSQTESFISDTGMFRVRWEAKRSDPARQGALRLTLHSAISGRPVATATEQHGAGTGESVVYEESGVYYVNIDSTDVDWHFTLEEAVIETTAGQIY